MFWYLISRKSREGNGNEREGPRQLLKMGLRNLRTDSRQLRSYASPLTENSWFRHFSRTHIKHC